MNRLSLLFRLDDKRNLVILALGQVHYLIGIDCPIAMFCRDPYVEKRNGRCVGDPKSHLSRDAGRHFRWAHVNFEMDRALHVVDLLLRELRHRFGN